MSRVCVSAQTGASVYVFSDDHCPPHVHARHRGDDWVARVEFSFVTNHVRLMSVTPVQNTPSSRVIGQLLEDVRDAVPTCRNMWWAMQATVCLTNRWASLPLMAHTIVMKPERQSGNVQVKGAQYRPASNQLLIWCKNGTEFTIEAGSGLDDAIW